MSEEYIPQEVLTEIFTRLPIKSLLRCTSVCKSWYSLIKNPSFITTHLNSNTSPLLLLRHCTENYEEDRYSLHFDNDTLDLYSKLDCPFKSFTGYFKIVGYCHGLLCLSDCHIEPSFLWNPSIRVYVTLPKPSVTFGSHGPHTVVLGFGFDSLTNDYKVVRIVSIDRNGVRYSQEVEVYTLSTGAWRGIRASGPQCLVCESSPQVFMNGAAHWLAFYPIGLGKNLIVSFDMGDEVFREIMLPEGIDGGDLWTRDNSVAVFGECLSFIQHGQSFGNDSCCIWVMKEYGVVKSWVKQISIDLQGGLSMAFGFRKNGEVLMATCSEEVLMANCSEDIVSYDSEVGRIKNSGIRGIPYSFYVDTYIESLVLLNRANGVLGRQATSRYAFWHK